MEVPAHHAVRRDNADDLIGEQVRLDGTDPEPLEPSHQGESPEERREIGPGFSSVVADVHAGEDDLPVPARDKLSGLAHRFPDPLTPARSAGQRDRAEAAGVVAPVLHFQERARPPHRLRGPSRRKIVRRTYVADAHLGGDLLLRNAERSGDRDLFPRPHHEVHPFDRRHLLGLQLRVAARHDHDRLRSGTEGPADELPAFPVGARRDAARVDHRNVRRKTELDGGVPPVDELLPERGSLREVELAAECGQCDRWHGTYRKRSCPTCGQLLLVFGCRV